MKPVIFEMAGSPDKEFDYRLIAFEVNRLVEFRFLSIDRVKKTQRLVFRLEPSSLDKEFLGTEEKWDRQILAWRHIGVAWLHCQDTRYEEFLKQCYPHLIAYITVHRVMSQ